MVEKHSGVFVTEKFPQPKKETSGLSGSVALIGVTRRTKDIPTAVTNYKGELKNSEQNYQTVNFIIMLMLHLKRCTRLYLINPKN